MKKTMKLARLLACTALVSAAIGPLSLSASELLLPPSVDNAYVYAADVSANGAVVVGTLNPGQSWTRSGFIWTPAEGMQRVGGVTAGSILEKRFTANGVSNDGAVIVGQATPDMIGGGALARGYLWTAAGGFMDLGYIPGGMATSQANGVSGNGRVVVGEAPNATGALRGFRWTQESGMVSLGELAGKLTLQAWAASYDGSVIVGNSAGDYGVAGQGFRWTAASGIEALPFLNGGSQSYVRGVSDDGRVIVGQAHNGTSGRMSAVRWLDGNPQDLYTPGSGLGSNYSFGFGVSGNSKVVVGEVQVDNTTTIHGFRWTESGGMQTIGQWLTASGASISSDVTYAARAANCDGSVIVGETAHYSSAQAKLFIARGNGTGDNNCQMAGTPGDGGNTGGGDTDGGDTDGGDTGGGDTGGGDTGGGDTGGGDTGGGDTGGGDTGGGDTGGGDTGGGDTGGGDTGGGDTGGGDTGGGDTGGGTGLIIVDEFNESLTQTSAANAALLDNVNLLLNGAGSRPLDRRAADGKSIAWLGGDWGRVAASGNDGEIGFGEIGFGHNFGAFQLGATGGFTRFQKTTSLGGNTDLTGGFVKVEALSKLYATDQGGLWGAVTASAMWGNADMTRNYLNGGAVDSSQSSTDVSGYGLRGRLQWENAIRYVSPYADLSYSRACFDAYTETGGGFPAAFDKLCDNSTELRYGFDVTYPVTSGFRLIGTLEGVHRFEDASANITGQAIGLYGFDLGAAAYQQDWLRAGAGFEADIGASTLSVMGNATTQSSGADAWVAANWRIAF